MQLDTRTNERIALRVSRNAILSNTLLFAFKLAAGILAHSGAMISDAVHSLSDVLTTMIVIVGIKLSARASDRSHPYGHERMESVAAIILSVLLGLVGALIGYAGIVKIVSGEYGQLVIPGRLALIAAVVSIVMQETLYWYTRHFAKKIQSNALMADAWHHRSDALSSVGSFIGILGARMGLPVLDPIASVVICLFIIKVALRIFTDAVRRMTDEACDESTTEKIRHIIAQQPGVLRLDRLDTRVFGNRIYVDVEISADQNASLMESHHIAEQVHTAVETAFPTIKHCMVHVNPLSDEGPAGGKNTD